MSKKPISKKTTMKINDKHEIFNICREIGKNNRCDKNPVRLYIVIGILQFTSKLKHHL